MIISKSEFARACNITPGRVSQYIKAHQLTPPALVGEGRAQKVDLELGRAQLKARLDIDQRYSMNGLNTRLDDPKPASDWVANDVRDFFIAAIPGLATALAAKLNCTDREAYLYAEEWFDAIEAVPVPQE
jgi:hypothetical protein